MVMVLVASALSKPFMLASRLMEIFFCDFCFKLRFHLVFFCF